MASPTPPPLPKAKAAPLVVGGQGRDATPGRVLLAALGALALAYSVLRLVELGWAPDLVSSMGAVTRIALGLALLAAAARPRAVARMLHAPRLNSAAGLGAFALLAFALYFVFGVGTLVSTAALLQQLAAGEHPLGEAREVADLLASLGLSFVVFTVPALAWAGGAEGQRGKDLWGWLGLRREGARWSVIWAMVTLVLVFWMLLAVGLGARLLGYGPVENPQAEAIARNLTVPLVLVVAVLTGVGEEVFFRGLLLRKLGNPAQAVLFGIAHLNYLQALEVVLTGVLGYAFGRTAQRTGSLVGPILGHALFNALNMLLFLYRDQLMNLGGG